MITKEQFLDGEVFVMNEDHRNAYQYSNGVVNSYYSTVKNDWPLIEITDEMATIKVQDKDIKLRFWALSKPMYPVGKYHTPPPKTDNKGQILIF